MFVVFVVRRVWLSTRLGPVGVLILSCFIADLKAVLIGLSGVIENEFEGEFNLR